MEKANRIVVVSLIALITMTFIAGPKLGWFLTDKDHIYTYVETIESGDALNKVEYIYRSGDKILSVELLDERRQIILITRNGKKLDTKPLNIDNIDDNEFYYKLKFRMQTGEMMVYGTCLMIIGLILTQKPIWILAVKHGRLFADAEPSLLYLNMVRGGGYLILVFVLYKTIIF